MTFLISIKLAGPSQQNQTRFVGIFSIYLVLNCTIKDSFVLSVVLKKIVSLRA